MKPAPIVLFVYNRIDHVKQTIEGLLTNDLAGDSDLIIYSDASKDPSSRDKVDEVRKYISEKITGFKSLNYVYRETNYGLTNNIISGVTDVVNKYGKVIVLEDDIVTGPHFLKYMNDALDKYESEKNVFEISGYIEPLDLEITTDCFFIKRADCWGWATWADRWKYYERNPYKTYKSFSRKEIRDFNMDGSSSEWNQVVYNLSGKLNSWAVFWNATVYKHHGLVLVPKRSLITNTGCDGSGTNYTEAVRKTDTFCTQLEIVEFPEKVMESLSGRAALVDYLRSQRPDVLRRIWRDHILIYIEVLKWHLSGKEPH